MQPDVPDRVLARAGRRLPGRHRLRGPRADADGVRPRGAVRRPPAGHLQLADPRGPHLDRAAEGPAGEPARPDRGQGGGPRAAQAEASDFVYDTWVGRTLEVDFPPFIAHAVHAPGSYRNILAATFQTYLGRATDRALDLVTVRQKIRAELVAQGRWDGRPPADAYFEDIGFVPRAEVRDGRVVAVVPDGPEARLPPRAPRPGAAALAAGEPLRGRRPAPRLVARPGRDHRLGRTPCAADHRPHRGPARLAGRRGRRTARGADRGGGAPGGQRLGRPAVRAVRRRRVRRHSRPRHAAGTRARPGTSRSRRRTTASRPAARMHDHVNESATVRDSGTAHTWASTTGDGPARAGTAPTGCASTSTPSRSCSPGSTCGTGTLTAASACRPADGSPRSG